MFGMEHAPCLRIKKVWHGSKRANQQITVRNQFAPKRSDVLKVTEDSVDSHESELDKATINRYGKRKKGQNISKEKQRELDDQARIKHNRMLIKEQKDLATRRNYLRKQHQIKTGALKKMQEKDRMVKGDTLTYRLAARKSFLTLQIRLKQAHRDLIRSLRHHVCSKMAEGSMTLNRGTLEDDDELPEGSKESAMTKTSEYSEDEINVSFDKDGQIMCDKSSVQEQPSTKCTEKLPNYSSQDLKAAYEKFTQLPLSPCLLVINPDIVYDIIRSFRCVTTAEIRDAQVQVLNRMRSMFLLYNDDDFITTFIEKAIWHKRSHHVRLLQLDFICESEVQTEYHDPGDSGTTAEADTDTAVVPENTHTQSSQYLDHLIESNKENLDLTSRKNIIQSKSLTEIGNNMQARIDHSEEKSTVSGNQLKSGESIPELESLTDEEVAVPDVLGDSSRSFRQNSVQVVPGNAGVGLCDDLFKQTVMNDSPEGNNASFFLSEEVKVPVKNCQQMDTEDSLEIIKGLTAPEE